MRGIEEPATEASVRGSRERFVETPRTNTSMLRRIIHNPKLQVKKMVLGEMTQTEVAIVYLEGIAVPEIVLESTIDLNAYISMQY